MRIAKEEKLSGLENHKYHAQKIRYPCNIINYTMPNKIAFITCQTYVLFLVGKIHFIEITRCSSSKLIVEFNKIQII